MIKNSISRGFITVATGNERYYRMALNLLRSYRMNCESPMRFAIIADQNNQYTAEFDDVIILDHATKSWMDKLALLTSCPYDENIFIDADCLVYHDINFFLDLFSSADDFSCFGKVLPMDSTEGWYTRQAEQIYPIKSIIHLHGTAYFIRKSPVIEEMNTICMDIISKYHLIKFRDFNDRLADEPIFALAMGILGLRPIPRKQEYYCFVPYAIKMKSDYLSRTIRYVNPGEDECIWCHLLHWGNVNTEKAAYRVEVDKLNYLTSNRNRIVANIYKWFFYDLNTLYCVYHVKDTILLKFQKLRSNLYRIRKRLSNNNSMRTTD